MTGSETGCSVRHCAAVSVRVTAALAVAGLVVVSTAIRFAAAQAFTTPWIAPDEMVYGLIGESLWSHGTLEIRGLPTPYYSILTPALVGAPLGSSTSPTASSGRSPAGARCVARRGAHVSVDGSG